MLVANGVRPSATSFAGRASLRHVRAGQEPLGFGTLCFGTCSVPAARPQRSRARWMDAAVGTAVNTSVQLLRFAPLVARKASRAQLVQPTWARDRRRDTHYAPESGASRRRHGALTVPRPRRALPVASAGPILVLAPECGASAASARRGSRGGRAQDASISREHGGKSTHPRRRLHDFGTFSRHVQCRRTTSM